jgi:hypothetical protein
MRRSVFKWTITLVLACASWGAAGCGNDGGGTDGGGGAGGSGTAPDGGGGDTGETTCTMMSAVACPNPPVNYGKIQPIVQARCVNVCHNGMTPDPNDKTMNIWALTDYRHLKDWESTVREAVGNCSMPPADAGVPVTVEERKAILEFIRCGLPQ